MSSFININKSTSETISTIKFEDIYKLEDIQLIQDLFSKASGVASVITHPDGTPITTPSNFCRLCEKIIRKTEKGREMCAQSNAIKGLCNISGPFVWSCRSSGLWEAAANITVGGELIARWIIGQVRNEFLNEQQLYAFADEIGAERVEFQTAYNEVPVLSSDEFSKVTKMLYSFARELSERGNTNLQLKIQTANHEKATTALEEHKEKFHFYFENASDILFQTDLDGTIVEISPSISDLAEYERDELIGKSVTKLYEDASEREILLDILNKKGFVRGSEIKMKTKSDKIRYVFINANLIKGTNDHPEHIIGTIRDITDRKMSEVILKESEERYRSLFENMLNGFAFCQMIYEDGFPTDFIFLKVNKAFEPSTGLKNVEGRKVSDVIPGFKEIDGNMLEIYGRVALTGIPECFEMQVQSLNDWYTISVYSPQKGYFIAVFDVITERKHAEQELTKAKEKAEESDRLKTAFLNNISHEIRTPFNGILGLLSLLQDHDLEEEEREEYIGIINESADRLMNTINDIVEVSHIQSGQAVLTIQDTNLKKLSDELFDRFNPFAENKRLEFIIQNNLPIVSILTDGSKLKSILSKLIGNALKFTRAGSVEIFCNMKGDFLEFQVKDTGIGISKDKQKVIFERFMQSNVTNTREFEGLGLGLTIAKAYVMMLGGELWLESEVGNGSTFYFTILNNTNPE